jgi:periplasmic divalent cation tolerance protein
MTRDQTEPNADPLGQAPAPPDATDLVLALTTVPDEATAKALSRAMLERRIAACVNAVPGVRSAYWWEGRIEEAQEWMLLIKTSEACWAALQALCASTHPYEVFELVMLQPRQLHPPYRRWWAQALAGPEAGPQARRSMPP